MVQDTYEVEHLALRDEVVQAVHHLLDSACPVPLQGRCEPSSTNTSRIQRTDPMDVQYVYVTRAEVFEGLLDGQVERLHVVPHVAGLLWHVFATFPVASVLHEESVSGMPSTDRPH